MKTCMNDVMFHAHLVELIKPIVAAPVVRPKLLFSQGTWAAPPRL